MQRFESLQNINNGSPDIILGHPCMRFDMVIDHFHEVATFRIFHNNTETIGWRIKESLFELDDVLVVEGGENSNLVEGILFLFIFHAE